MKKACAHARSIAALGFVLACVLLAWCPCMLALNPELDVSQYAHTAWKVRDGFTKSRISTIAQTPDGYLWLGTEFGLIRFDGVRAVPWEPQGQPLASTFIDSLLAASDGTLWIGTLKGLVSWKAGKLTQYPELADYVVSQLLEDREGTVWVGAVGTALGTTTGRLCAIRKGSVHCSEDASFKTVTGLYEDSKGTLWVGVRDGLWRWKPGPPKFFSLPGEPNGIHALGEDTDGTLLVGWKGGLWRFVDGKTEAYPLPRSLQKFQMSKLLRDTDGGLWIGTNDRGIVRIHNGKTDVFSVSDGLSSENAEYVFQDREGSIWIATHGGLDRFRDFTVATISVNQGLSDVNVGSVVADGDGTVWLTNRTLQRWKNGRVVSDDKDEERFRGRIPHSLFRDHHGRIWVCTIDGAGYFDNKQFIEAVRIPWGSVHGITEDAAGNVWIAGQNAGLFRLSVRGEVQKIPQDSLGSQDLIYALAGDPVQGGVWVGFFKGGITYLRDGQARASYSTADGLGEGWVTELRVDPDGTLWATTRGGLSRLKNGHISTLNSKNGLPCDAVHWLIEDDYHALWVKTACGLVRIERPDLDAWAAAADRDKDTKRTVHPTVFGSPDGVRVHAIPGGYAGRVARSPDGKLWLARLDDGLGVVDPKHLPVNKIEPPVHIEQITADRKTYDVPSKVSANENEQVRLPPLIRDLEIDYTALSLVAPEKVRFRYKLEGWDRDWQDVGTRRQAFYNNLPPRKYRFRVAACNNSGVWNEAGTFLDFAVAPAYYQTLWFRLSCVAAFLALLWGLYQLRLREVAREFNMRLEERVTERTRIARELHDSLLQGFQGLMFRLQAVRDMFPGPREALQALDIALERGDKAIAEARDAVSDLRPSLMSDMAQALTALGAELAAHSDNSATPCVRVVVEGKQRELNPMLRDEIYRIAREALRNAFRHAKAQKIEAEITYDDSEFLLHVRDDGSGIDPAVVNQGARAGHWGLPGMRERAKRFGGKLEVWSERGAGTEIELSVPAAIAYGKSDTRPRFWFLRRRTGQTDGQQP